MKESVYQPRCGLGILMLLASSVAACGTAPAESVGTTSVAESAASTADASSSGSTSSSGSGGAGAMSSSAAGATGSSAAGTGGGSVASTTGAGGEEGGGDPGTLAARPYMGWSSWSTHSTGDVNESNLETTADALATQLLSYGYEYINVDDGWMKGVDANGRWAPDPAKFPKGIAPVADYVHKKGLKFGIYLVPGLLTAAYDANLPIAGTPYHAKDIVSNPGAAGNTNKKGSAAKKIDFTRPGAVEYVQGYADLMASWGVDFIKMDFVGPGGGGGSADDQEDIKQWRAALDKTGRPIWLELSNQLSISAIATWKAYSNGWRVATDVEAYSGTLTNWTKVKRIIDAVPPFVPHAGPGGWNDLDSLEVGNGNKDGISLDERYTVYTFWAISAAPLYLGSDVTKLDPADLKILTNKEVIAVNQAGVPAKPVSTSGDQQVWFAKLGDGSFVVGLFNFGTASASVTAKFSDVGAPGTTHVRDLWSQSDLGTSSKSWGATIPAHGTRLVKLTP